MGSTEQSFWDAVDTLREHDPRYRREAYGFVVGALAVAVRALPADRLADPVRRHLSGQELLAAIVDLGRREFGALAATVFHEWGVRSGEDIGRIVFELVRVGQLSARDEDTLDDFRSGHDLLKALRGPDPASARR